MVSWQLSSTSYVRMRAVGGGDCEKRHLIELYIGVDSKDSLTQRQHFASA